MRLFLPADEPSKTDLAKQQLQRQAEQLADYLRDRQNQLDHRKAQLNAEIALMESEVRGARLWLSEREAELAEQRQALENQEKEFLERLERLAAAEGALQRQAGPGEDSSDLSARLSTENKRFARLAEELNEERRQWEIRQRQAENALQYERQQFENEQAACQQLLRQRESQLEKHRQALEERAAKASTAPASSLCGLTLREEDIFRGEAAMQKRQQELEAAENRLFEAQAEALKIHEQLTADRRQLSEEIHRRRQKLIDEQRQAMAELEKKHRILKRRGERVDQSRASLLQVRAELRQMHRQTLEMHWPAKNFG